MDLISLNIIRRVEILKKFLNTNNRLLFEQTINSFIGDNTIESLEKVFYHQALKHFHSSKIVDANESLEILKHKFVMKIFDTSCDKKWDGLIPTNNIDIKFCGDCNRNVFKVFNKEDYRKHKQLNHCVAIKYYQTEKIGMGTGCEISIIEDFELLGSPSVINNE